MGRIKSSTSSAAADVARYAPAMVLAASDCILLNVVRFLSVYPFPPWGVYHTEHPYTIWSITIVWYTCRSAVKGTFIPQRILCRRRLNSLGTFKPKETHTVPLSKVRCELATINYRGYAHLALSQVKITAVGGNLIACSSISEDRTALCPIRLRLTSDPIRLRTSHKSDNIGHFIHFPNSLQETQVTDHFLKLRPYPLLPPSWHRSTYLPQRSCSR